MNLLLNIRAKYCFLRANGIYYNCQQKGVDRMAGNTTNISIRMDADLKAQADALFTPSSNRAKYCPECAARMKRINAAKRKRKQREKCHALGAEKPL